MVEDCDKNDYESVWPKCIAYLVATLSVGTIASWFLMVIIKSIVGNTWFSGIEWAFFIEGMIITVVAMLTIMRSFLADEDSTQTTD